MLLKMRKTPHLMLLLFSGLAVYAQSTLVQQAAERGMDLSQFPYENYLDTVEIDDFQQLETDRRFLLQHLGQDHFLLHLGQAYTTQNPVTQENLEEAIELGEAWLGYKAGLNAAQNETYRAVGYFLLGRAARYLEQAVARRERQPSDPETRALLARLESRKVFVKISKSKLTKLAENLERGNLDYVVRRCQLKLDAHFLPYKNLAGIHRAWPLFLFLALCCVLVFAAFKRKRLVLLVCSFFICGPLLLSFGGRHTSKFLASYSLQPDRFLHDNTISVDRINARNGQKQGHAIWLPLQRLNPDYFANGDVPAYLAGLQEKREIFLATAGGFTNHLKQPEGLTLQRGELVNAVLQPNRHGLVLITAKQGLYAYNLMSDYLDLPNGRRLANPLHCLAAYAELINWCERERITVFQTQLVVHENKLLIDPEKAVKRFRERRMLALVRNDETGERHHVLINIKEPHMLAPISAELHAVLKSRNLYVDALLNLDVGIYDILNIYDDQGKPITDLKGTCEGKEATNLIVYTYTKKI